jgi:hypothetical protein
MITITTQQKQFELRINFSFAGVERAWQLATGLLSFSQIHEIEKQKLDMQHNAGFNFWRI